MSLQPARSRSEYLDIDGGKVHVLRSAEPAPPGAVPLLLVHGGGYDNAAISWWHLFARFGAEHDVLAFDMPGFGRTTGLDPVGGPEAMADLIARGAAALGIDRAVVVGVSMGGDVALNLALRHPSLVAGLALIAPGGLTPRLGGALSQYGIWLATRLPDALLRPLTRIANRYADRSIDMLVVDRTALPAEVVGEFVREAQRPDAGMGYGRYNQATVGPRGMRNDLTPRLAGIDVPTLLFHGADDRMVSPDDSRRAARLLPDARLRIIDACGHWAQLEKPELFAQELSELLADITPAQ